MQYRPDRGAGPPESKYILERLIVVAPRESNTACIEQRRRNSLPPDGFPWKAPN